MRHLATVSTLLASMLAPPAVPPARGDDPRPPASLLFTAGDFPALAEGVAPPPAGRYVVKAWAPASQGWALSVDGATLRLVEAPVIDSAPEMTWREVGAADIASDRPLVIAVDRPTAANEDSKDPNPKTRAARVPTLLALATDPGFDPSAAMDVIRGRLDSSAPPTDPRRTTSRTNWQGADFRAPATPQAWRDRARAVREQLLVTTGLWPMPPKTALNPQVYGLLDRGDYTIEKVVLETLPGFALSGNLYRPKGKAGRLPALLCPHGHWPEGRVNVDVQARCVRWAKLGAVVFVYDMVGRADSTPFGHAFDNDRLRRWGLSLASLQTWDSIRALDWLSALPFVDPARVACTGESGGGTQTFLLGAIDDRLAAAAPVVMVSDTFQGGCVCENAPGLRLGTDNVEFAALFAPKPMKLVGATGDWTSKTLTNAYPAIRGIYDLMGRPDRVSADVFDFPHNYNQTTRNAVYAFLGHWLLGIDDDASTREGEQAIEAPEALLTFDATHPRPADAKAPAALERDLIAGLGRSLDALYPANAAMWEAARDRLKAALSIRVGLTEPTPAELAVEPFRASNHPGYRVEHVQVGRLSTAGRIAAVRLTPPRSSGRLTVVFSDRGKADLVTAAGGPSPLARALLDRGQSVVGFDASLVGESVDSLMPPRRRPPVLHFETYNPVVAMDRMQDLATVLAWARSLPDARDVSLVGTGRSGTLALLARPMLGGIARTAVDVGGVDYGDGSSPVPDGFDLPGVLQFGGPKVAAALAAPAPVLLSGVGPAFATDWARRAYDLADASASLRVVPGPAGPEAVARWVDAGE